jgi:NifU-like protein involved in Fe-S cluster formation
MSPDPYSRAVRDRFANPLHAGELPASYADAVTADVRESEAGTAVMLAAQVDGAMVRRLRYRVFGCPHLIAAAEEICARFEGRNVQDLQEFPLAALMELLDVPVEKTGRLLLLEDAVHSLARAILAREPSAAADNRRK